MRHNPWSPWRISKVSISVDLSSLFTDENQQCIYINPNVNTNKLFPLICINFPHSFFINKMNLPYVTQWNWNWWTRAIHDVIRKYSYKYIENRIYHPLADSRRCMAKNEVEKLKKRNNIFHFHLIVKCCIMKK